MPTVNNYKRNLILIFVMSFLAIIIINLSPIVYVAPMFILAFSFVGGFLEPYKGWQLALLQITLIIGAYWLNDIFKIITPANKEAAFFATHTSPLATLSASFMGALIKKM